MKMKDDLSEHVIHRCLIGSRAYGLIEAMPVHSE